MIGRLTLVCAAALVCATPAAPALASSDINTADSFRVGSSGVLCTAQRQSEDQRFVSMFDRGFELVCRDAAAPVGHAYALRGASDAAQHRLDAARDADIACAAPVAATIPGLRDARKADCTAANGLRYTIYSLRAGQTWYASEGLAAYDSVLQLALRSVVSGRQVAGAITVATTEAGDPAALARVQAERLDAGQALAAGYSHNNEGSYAEAAEFFANLVARSQTDNAGGTKSAVYLANMALQQSNLGHFDEAEKLFTEAARAADGTDTLFAVQYRNLRAMHQLNRHDPAGALATLGTTATPFEANPVRQQRLAEGYIDAPLSQRLAVDDDTATRLGGGSAQLTEAERATLLGAQGSYLRAVALRWLGKPAEAESALSDCLKAVAAVRGGSVKSMTWLQAAALSEQAVIAEARGNLHEARLRLQASVDLTAAEYPESATLLAAKARLAGLMTKTGETPAALALFREIVQSGSAIPGGGEALRGLMAPYFEALVKQPAHDRRAAEDFFAASQVLVRPGVAQTQAVFARELSGGSDEAASYFRQSLQLTRELVSSDVEISRLLAIKERTPMDDAALVKARDQRAELRKAQTLVLARLAAYPKFRVVNNAMLGLAELEKSLRPGEGYYKMLFVGDRAYAMLVEPEITTIYKIGARLADLDALAHTIRDSILSDDAGQQTTSPFALVEARKLYEILFGPVDAEMPAIKHLIYEPDGPLLKLPANLLVTDQSGVDSYLARSAKPNADAFDFTGVSWLGRTRMVSTAVSPQAFIDVRAIPPSKAPRRYLGLGQNTPIKDLPAAVRPSSDRDPCDWPLSLWNHPIKADELTLAVKMLGGNGDAVISQNDFTDVAIAGNTDLHDFRIIQFATHGLVTAPHAGCPARPALLTSFGGGASDGLLSFKEIFDLHLDADTIILSACDTAGAASAAATREAGISTGGNFALDGLVRAFVGAGARTVIASHWPVPDDYNATKRLMSGIYEGGTRMSVGEAMRRSQLKLMDDPLTSHPYYWAAFAIVGDADKPLTSD